MMLETMNETAGMPALWDGIYSGWTSVLRVSESMPRLRAMDVAAVVRAVPLGSPRGTIRSRYMAAFGSPYSPTHTCALVDGALKRVDERCISVWRNIAILCQKMRVYWEAHPTDLLGTITVDHVFETMRLEQEETPGLSGVDVFYDADGNYAGLFAFSLAETAARNS